jgi:hypothetical protein
MDIIAKRIEEKNPTNDLALFGIGLLIGFVGTALLANSIS